jgi:hypothetical protein
MELRVHFELNIRKNKLKIYLRIKQNNRKRKRKKRDGTAVIRVSETRKL